MLLVDEAIEVVAETSLDVVAMVAGDSVVVLPVLGFVSATGF